MRGRLRADSARIRPPASRSLAERAALWAALVVAALVLQLAATPFHVLGASMLPYAEDGDLLVANRVASPGTGDIVVLRAPSAWGVDEELSDSRIVKRVIAVAGDQVSCCDADGAIVRNGEPLAERYLAAPGVPSRIGFDLVVPPGHIWVMGDNRDVSRDSRLGVTSRTHGAVPLSAVIAVVWVRLS